ncbi:MAG: hypothetical protein IJH79_16140 [Lentisphaeria bacterium]|nr:hypothetical protein [Lentisphaeria bacterium]
MPEVKPGIKEFSIYFSAAWNAVIASGNPEKSAKNAEKTMGLRTRYGKHKNAHVGSETARCSLRRGAAEPA